MSRSPKTANRRRAPQGAGGAESTSKRGALSSWLGRFQRLLRSLEPHHYALGAVLVLAAGLRVYGLTYESLWNDELSTVAKIASPPWDPDAWQAIMNDVHPPGHVVFTWLFTQLFGKSEFALRLPSVIFGVLGVALVYRIGSRWYGRAAGWVGAMLAAVSPFLIEYSQVVRGYSAIFFTAAWTLFCWLELSRDDIHAGARRRRVVGTALVTAAGAYLHYSGLLFGATVAALALGFAALRRRDRVFDLLRAAGLSALLYAPWAPGLWQDLETGGLGFLGTPTLRTLTQFPTVAVPAYVYLACAMLAAVSSSVPDSPLGSRPQSSTVFVTLFLSLCCLVLVLGFYLKSILGQPIYNAQNLIVAWPPVFVLLGAAATSRGDGPRMVLARGAIVSSVALVVILEFVYVEEFYSRLTFQHFRQASQTGLAWLDHEPRARIVAYSYPRRFDYYLDQFGYDEGVAANPIREEQVQPAVARLFERGASRVLLLTGHKEPRAPLEMLQRRYRVVRDQRFPGATATLFERRSSKARGGRRQGRRGKGKIRRR